MTIKSATRGNALTFKKLLKKVIRTYRGFKVYMVLDNVRFHHAKRLKSFLEKHKNALELIFLPPYSPDLNPSERAWWYMRKKITHNRAIETLAERKKQFWKMFSHYQKPNAEMKNICIVNY
jgi:transposase